MTGAERPIRTLIVDDEPPARRGLARLLSVRPAFVVVGQSPSGRSAIRDIRELKPDLVILDVQMPDVDGFGVVRGVGPALMPAVIFATAYDQFALGAFEAQALDYLLKPFGEKRLDEALRRAHELIELRRSGDLASRLTKASGETALAQAGPRTLDRIVVRSLGRTEVVSLADVVRIEAAGYCVRLHTRDRVHVHRESMRSLDQRLPADQFARVHRSTFVNVAQIREVRRTLSGSHELTLQDQSKIRISRSRWNRVDALLVSWAGRS